MPFGSDNYFLCQDGGGKRVPTLSTAAAPSNPGSHSDLTDLTSSATAVPAPSKHELIQRQSHRARLDGDPALEEPKKAQERAESGGWRQWGVRGGPP